MAVPKKKRSKEKIKLRRTVFATNSLNKAGISLRKYSNFFINKNDDKKKLLCDSGSINCGFFNKSKSHKMCIDCYVVHFRQVFNNIF